MEKKRKLRLETYKPRRKLKISKEEAVPFLVRIGSYLMTTRGVISFVLSGIIMGVKSFFHVKEKVDNKIFRRRYVELRIKKHQKFEKAREYVK